MRLEVRCRRCGRMFEPDRRAIVLGRWRPCPACQDPPPTGGAPTLELWSLDYARVEVA